MTEFTYIFQYLCLEETQRKGEKDGGEKKGVIIQNSVAWISIHSRYMVESLPSIIAITCKGC